MTERVDRPQTETSPRETWAIAATVLAIAAIGFAIAAFFLASEAKTTADDAKRAAERRLPTVPAEGATPTTATPATRVNVTETEFTVVPDITTAPAGRVTFTVTNKGRAQHELVVLSTTGDAKHLPVDKSGDAVEDGSGDKNVGEIPKLKKGETLSVTLRLSAGHYALICNIPGHYQAGMSAAFEVTA